MDQRPRRGFLDEDPGPDGEVSVVLKAVASALPVWSVTSPVGPTRRRVRRATWAAGIVLTGYGGVLTGVGLLVLAGIIPAAADADLRAIRWHALLWDPWFLVWGGLVLTALLRSRRREGRQRSSL